jgi:hypothetical protein
VFENRVLRRISRPKRYEMTEGWRNMQKLHNLYSAPNIIRLIKSKTVVWAVHVALMGQMRNLHKAVAKKILNRRDHMQEHGADGR